MHASSRQRRVIFVGAFAPAAPDGTTGGQIFACTSLLQSPLSQRVLWLLIDSTMRSQPPPPLAVRAWLALGRVLRLAWLLLTRRVDAVLIFTAYEPLSFMEKGLMALLARLRRRRVVLCLCSEIRPDRFDPWLLGYRRAVLRRCDRIIVQSPQAAERLGPLGVPAGRVDVIPNWLDLAEYSQVRHRPAADGATRFLFLGWLEDFKGVRELIGAARLLAGGPGRFRLTVCGGGSLAGYLQEQVRQAGLEAVVALPGWVYGAEKLRCLEEADVLVLPSYSEGLPNALLEAMACGLAAVVTPVGGIPSVVQDGVGGLLVPVGDPAALAAAMGRLMADPDLVRRMGEHNRQQVQAHHDIAAAWPAVGRTLGLGEGD